MNIGKVNFLFRHCCADVSGNIQIVAVFGNFFHADTFRIPFFFCAELIGIYNFFYVFRRESILPFTLFKMLRGIDEEHVIRLFTLFEHKDAHGNARGVKKVGGQADNGVYVAVFKQFAADALLRAATDKNRMGMISRKPRRMATR